ncbi:NAD(P)H-dependent flavin oxidoreductase [Chachezhania sediminis]|uniref:NAD(P)H-dependent flavin oxidoreductase n=1 Tax=Chachezhania sediminis TaxID=2599291 RepID=UPI00131B537B|nr:nitronate monooxygenase [Chachezhania sediminis]
MIVTPLTELFGLGAPIVQAGMAFAGMTPDLAIAVSDAGGLGSVAIGPMPVPVMQMLMGGVRQGTTRPFHVNFITIYTEEAHIDALCADPDPVAAASFHWGHPPKGWIDRLHAAGIKVMEQLGSVGAAKIAADDGVDVIVAQGTEAGGHNYGTLPIFALVPAVVDAAGGVPVLASGGVSDGRGLAAALCLGAAGVWVGSRFVASVESSAHADYKARLCAAQGTDTVLSPLFGRHHPHFNPMRILKNRVVAEFEGREDEVPADNSGEPVVGRMTLGGIETELRRFGNLVPMTDATGDFEELPLLCGQGLGGIASVEPAAKIVAEMAAEAEAILGRDWTAA